MKPDSAKEEFNLNLLHTPLEKFINMDHELIVLSKKINWPQLEKTFAKFYADVGRKGIKIRLIMGLQILQYTYNLSDEEVCMRWVENPYFQYFCGEKFFNHMMPIDRSNMTYWRKRVGSSDLDKILQETLAIAHDTGAISHQDVARIVVDTTVQTKAVDYPSHSKLLLDAIIDLGREAKKNGLKLKQNYRFMAKSLAAQICRYAHAKQMKRLKKGVKELKGLLFKLRRRIQGTLEKTSYKLDGVFKEKMGRALKVLTQANKGPDQIVVWHAPEVECICKGKARDRYEFGVKVSLATTINRSKGGHFVLSSEAIHGKPYDGHTLKQTIENVINITGVPISATYVDKGYQGHNYEDRLRVYKSGQRRGVFGKIKRELRRRSAIEPIIGHVKMSHKLDRHHLKGTEGDMINAKFAAIGFNFRQLLNWIRVQFYFLLILLEENLAKLDRKKLQREVWV